MNKLLQKIILGVMVGIAVINCKCICQEFSTSPLIDMPGTNLEFDVQTPSWGSRYNCLTFICWINKLDSVYAVYLKQLSPTVGDAMVVASDTRFKSRPQITSNTIGWQSMRDSLWQVSVRSYISNSLNPTVIILDSLTADPHFTLSNYRIAWIQNYNLYTKSYYPNLDSPFLVDSGGCSSPAMTRQDYTTNTEILYEKWIKGQKGISKAQYSGYPAPQWNYTLLPGDSARNPNYGLSGGVSFETIKNQISRIQYSIYGSSAFVTTTNQTCNYKNPNVFSYPIPVSKKALTLMTPFFVVFDSDSIPGNNEIFLTPFSDPHFTGKTINISQSLGYDIEPRVCYIFSNDTVFVAILWKHIISGKTDIWMAKTAYIPPSGVVNPTVNVNSFRLLQNYPNPFNPTTTIKYQVPDDGTKNVVSLRVYDMLGREIATLVNEQQPAGYYTRDWNAADVPGGVYFYRLQAGTFTETKKLVLLK